jgi:hypothetical protein
VLETLCQRHDVKRSCIEGQRLNRAHDHKALVWHSSTSYLDCLRRRLNIDPGVGTLDPAGQGARQAPCPAANVQNVAALQMPLYQPCHVRKPGVERWRVGRRVACALERHHAAPVHEATDE